MLPLVKIKIYLLSRKQSINNMSQKKRVGYTIQGCLHIRFPVHVTSELFEPMFNQAKFESINLEITAIKLIGEKDCFGCLTRW